MYRVLVSLRPEANDGWVWISRKNKRPRPIVRVRNTESKATVYCECLAIDENYAREYNQGERHRFKQGEAVITMNHWYRERLRIAETNKSYALEVAEVPGLWGKVMACLHHPQTVVRVATWLAMLSVTLGFVGIAIAITAMKISTGET